MAVPTTLQLPAEDVTLLRQQGAGALRRHAEFQRLLRDLAD